jgi:hypothetical protein
MPSGTNNTKVFINYRREDTAPYAGRLYDRLITHFGEDQVFIDIDHIRPGEDFVDAINAKVGACDVAIVLIGPQWLDVEDAFGERRLDQTEDFVRMEISAALERNIQTIPVLVGGARMPRRQELPEQIATLARKNAIELSETRFHSDVDRLIRAIDQFALAEGKTPRADADSLTRRISGLEANRQTVENARPYGRNLFRNIKLRRKSIAVGLGVVMIVLATIWGANRLRKHLGAKGRIDLGETKELANNSQRTDRAKPGHPFVSSIGLKLQWVDPLKMWVGQYEVTQAEFRAVTGNSPSLYQGERRPVDKVCWNDATEFCKKLTAKDRALGLITPKMTYRLPLSDEFDVYVDSASANDAVTSIQGPRRGTAEVGSLGPNEYGLYDVRGNVWEWMYEKVLRGACWDTKDQVGLAASYSFTPNPNYDCQNFGFRCVLTASSVKNSAENTVPHQSRAASEVETRGLFVKVELKREWQIGISHCRPAGKLPSECGYFRRISGFISFSRRKAHALS